MIGYFNNYIQIYWRTPTKRTYTELGLSLILISIFLVLAIRPSLLTAATLYQTIKEARGVIAQLNQKGAALAQARSAYQEEAARLSLLEKALPVTPKVLSFADQVSYVVRQKGLTVVVWELAGEPSPSGVGTGRDFDPLPEPYQEKGLGRQPSSLEFHLEVVGAFAAQRLFLAEMENFPRLIEISQVEFVASPESAPGLVLRVDGAVLVDSHEALTL